MSKRNSRPPHPHTSADAPRIRYRPVSPADQRVIDSRRSLKAYDRKVLAEAEQNRRADPKYSGPTPERLKKSGVPIEQGSGTGAYRERSRYDLIRNKLPARLRSAGDKLADLTNAVNLDLGAKTASYGAPRSKSTPPSQQRDAEISRDYQQARWDVWFALRNSHTQAMRDAMDGLMSPSEGGLPLMSAVDFVNYAWPEYGITYHVQLNGVADGAIMMTLESVADWFQQQRQRDADLAMTGHNSKHATV